MRLGLKNNLVGGASGLNADKLSLDLRFAADKTLTARKGPTPVFVRASAATFVGSNGLIQSAAINAARFDHDPVTLACKGLLIEEARTNLIVPSENLTSASWTTLASTITENAVTAPDGFVTGDTLVEDSSAATHQVIQQAPTITASSAYTFSVFAKAASHTSFQLVFSSAAFGAGLFANFILTGAGSVGTSSGLTTKIEGFPNGWYRCSVTINSASGGAGGFSQIVANNNNGSAIRLPSYLGTNAQTVHLWGAQLEAGFFPTSYIPTVSTSIVRSVDVCSITGSAFTGFWNRFAGTCVIGVGSSLGTGPRFVSNLTSARVVEMYGTGYIDFFESSGSQEVRIVTSPSYPIKLGLAYAINDYQSSYSGVLGGSDTNTGGTIPNATELHIGSLGGSSNRLTGHIQFIRYYKKRLANTKLQSLTT
jgi:hypothetical protein